MNASNVPVKGAPAFSVYSATKAPVSSFARSWIVDLKERKIRANAISSGPIETQGWKGRAQNEEQDQQIKSSLTAGLSLGRLGKPDEIAKAAVFLASQDSNTAIAIELFVDGGSPIPKDMSGPIRPGP